ncbi:hypothetical protein [Cyanobium sp. PCC 7001]|uniref:hypothetical protein n=1 Tax=Cyanobium sp. PCC 7001 TaxID=180281 RepID=UPI00067FA769|nr:hypothetical protein [Cyanobium sp. PCC 7001]
MAPTSPAIHQPLLSGPAARRRPLSRPKLFQGGLVALGAALLPLAGVAPHAEAQQAGYGQTLGGPIEDNGRDVGTGAPRTNSNVLDATNPIDLMNRLRRATALDDATPPGDAVDAALRDFDSQTASPGAAPLRSP